MVKKTYVFKGFDNFVEVFGCYLNYIILLETKNIDLLFTQFSYANWIGNKEDKETMRKHAQNKIDQIEYQIEVFKPKYTIPFASFVWFSHEENFYMNQEINRIDQN